MKIVFSNSPWWLLLIIPAVVLCLLPHLKLAKRYRRTRNRITSIVLHLTVMVLAILTMAGLEFHSMIPNEKNEIILLVDVSDTEEQSKRKRDQFVEQVLEDSQYDNYRVGVVTFGYDQVYAVPLTYEIDSIYDGYLLADEPDKSATNLADALEYTRNLFDNPTTGKIVLITDGKETDKEAVGVIRSVAAQGTKLDVAYIPSQFEGTDVQIVGVELPEYHVNKDEECTLTVVMQSNESGTVELFLEDKGEGNIVEEVESFSIGKGEQVISFKHTFSWEGLHEISFTAKMEGDVLNDNNVYSTYLNLEVYNKVLVLESVKDSSIALTKMMNENQENSNENQENPNENQKSNYEFDVMHITDDTVPKTVDTLRLYDQVILNNISNSDLKKISADFDKQLEEYVNVIGGGLFTVGGHELDGSAHSYNRKDMGGTLYQQMLPVQAINYTPPVAVMIVIDRSGSMNESDSHGDVKLEAAKAGAASCLSALSERDYVGIMTLDEAPEILLPLTSRVKEHAIRGAINKVVPADDDATTMFTDTIERAGQALRGIDNVAKRHILLVTDGEPNDKPSDYEPIIRNFNEANGITFSVVMIDNPKGSQAYNAMKAATDIGGGETFAAMSTSELVRLMKEDLNSAEITEVVVPDDGFAPIIKDMTSPLVQGLDRVDNSKNFNKLTAKLDGFFGVKERVTADVVLVGDFNVPLYAQWAYGEGMVGSFMCDLNNVWSQQFMTEESGKQFIRNVVNNLMPTESIRAPMMNYKLSEDNYTNLLSVFTAVDVEKEYIKAEMKGIDESGNEFTLSLNEASAKAGDFYVTTPFSKTNGYSRCEFVVKGTGVYKIVLTKCLLDGTVVKENGEKVEVEIYKSFAHSEEYDTVEDVTTAKTTLEYLVNRANGSMIEDLDDPMEIFKDFVTELPKVFDPRYLFMILAITLFLADIAVRKFKFKWPHEIIRGYQEKKKSK